MPVECELPPLAGPAIAWPAAFTQRDFALVHEDSNIQQVWALFRSAEGLLCAVDMRGNCKLVIMIPPDFIDGRPFTGRDG